MNTKYIPDIIDCEIIGKHRDFFGFAKLEEAKEDDLVWCKYNDEIFTESRIIVIKDTKWLRRLDPNLLIGTYIIVDNPRLAFAKIVNHFRPIKSKIHPAAIVDKCKLGNNCTIHAGASIGVDGFGFVWDTDHWEKFQCLKGVVIGDNVEIGANSCVDCGSLSDTIIGSGTKIDNLVHISHNCVIGENCLIAARVVICGSVTVGNNVFIAPGVSIVNGVTIGDNVFIGMGSIVTKDIPKGQKWLGNPAVTVEEFRKERKFIKDGS